MAHSASLLPVVPLLTCIVSVSNFVGTLAAPAPFTSAAIQIGEENGVQFSFFPACGGTSYRDGRIIGGREAGEGEVPWIVSIQNRGSHFCGGSIIEDKFIISAAHCFSHLDEDAELSVVLGAHRITTTDSEGIPTSKLKYDRIPVQRVTNHPEFDGGLQYLNDIAVVELAEKISWSSFVRPICLPDAGENFGRTAADKDKNKDKLNKQISSQSVSAVASGWGRTWGVKLQQERNDVQLDFEDDYKVHSDVLKTLNLTILPNSECDEYYQKSWAKMTLAPSQLCAGVRDSDWREDTASGDSGGPLSIFQHGRWTIAGVTSFGTPYSAPGVYCRVSSFLSWINELTTSTEVITKE